MSYEEAGGAWLNPPPPGTFDDQQYSHSSSERPRELGPGKYVRDRKYSRSRSRSYGDRDCTNSRSRSQSRSRDYHSKRTRDRRKRSRSRDYRKRRSRSRSGSRKRYSEKRHSSHRSYRSKHSRSRSRSHSRRHKRSYTRSRSISPPTHGRSKSYSSSSDSDASPSNYISRTRKYHPEVPKNQEYIRKAYAKHSDDEGSVQENTFKNDGSFLEMFKKMQEQQAETKVEEPEASVSDVKKPTPLFGKRRGGRILKTGMVQKLKNPNELEEEPKDAWSVYMKEVRKYKEACCDDDSKTRPLVK